MPTEFEIKCAELSAGVPWPDISHVKFVEPVLVEPVPCKRCSSPTIGDKCGHCHARQSTYGPRS